MKKKLKLDNNAFKEYMKEYEKECGTTQPDVLEKIVREVDYVFKITRRISNRKTKIKRIYENTNQNRI